MKKNITLSSYATFAAALLAGNKLQSQMVINDYEPDLRILNWGEFDPADDSLTVDIDGNGIYDLLFTIEDGWWTDKLFVEPNDMVSGLYAGFGFDDYLYGILQGGTIDPGMDDSRWTNEKQAIRAAEIYSFAGTGGTGCLYYYQGNITPYNYFGLKLNIGGETHFGWMRLSARTVNLHNDGFACENEVGSPLTIFEIGYNTTPDEPVIAANNKIEDDINASFEQSSDAGDFSDLNVHLSNFDVAGSNDCEEIRIFLINNKSEAMSFTVADALNIPPENYTAFTVPAFFSEETIPLTAATKDINGNAFIPDSSYTAYIMKINYPVDSAAATLSAPSPVVRALPRECSVSVIIYPPEIVDHTGTPADINVTFTRDYYPDDVSAYRVALGTDGDLLSICDQYNAGMFDEGEFILVPETGAASYTVNLSGIINDLNGDPIIPGNEYFVVISAVSDGYYADLPCLNCSTGVVMMPTAIDQVISGDIHMYVSGNILYAAHQINDGGNSIEILNITGQIMETADANNELNTIDLNKLPAGIYLAVSRQNGKISGSLKFRIDH